MKDKEWLKEQFTYYREAVGQTFNDVSSGMNNAYDNVEKLIDQLEEPEVTEEQAWEKIAEYYPGSPIGMKNSFEHFYYGGHLEKKPVKPVVPKFVADYIELNKGWSEERQEYFGDDGNGLWFALSDDGYGMPNSVSDWLFNEEKVETFARAWLDGYEVEREKRYYIIDKTNNSTLMTFELSDVVGEEVIEFVYGYSENETIHFNSKEKAELIAHFVGESLEVEEVTK